MSGIAELLANLGYGVSGSDEKRSVVTERLASLGIRVAYGHDPANVGEADVVVVSSAVRPTNPEVREAARRQIPVIPRGELMAAEADESDRSFLKLFPTIAVITNIDLEHPENYGGIEDLQQAFLDFANKVPFYGAVVACTDDSRVAALLPRLARRVTTYGLDDIGADITAADVALAPMGSQATVERRTRRAEDAATAHVRLGGLTLQVPGRHNLQNALAAVAVGLELGLPFERIAPALAQFAGPECRFEVPGEPNRILAVDD